jgi:hypothetical protein
MEAPADVYVDDVLVKCHLYTGIGATSDERVS